MKDSDHPSYDGSIKEIITHDRFEGMIEHLASQILAAGKQYDSIYGIPRGGLVPAVYLSHYLGIEYKGEVSQKEFEREALQKKILVVDDLVDTGRALIPYAGFDSAVLYRKPWAKSEPTYYCGETDKWIVFPWERQRVTAGA